MRIDIKRIKKLNEENRQFWFSPATIRFFRSRYPRTAHQVGEKAYFVSSEQFDDNSPRLYTIRVCDLTTGGIDTVGKFQEFKTFRAAYKKMSELLQAEA